MSSKIKGFIIRDKPNNQWQLKCQTFFSGSSSSATDWLAWKYTKLDNWLQVLTRLQATGRRWFKLPILSLNWFVPRRIYQAVQQPPPAQTTRRLRKHSCSCFLQHSDGSDPEGAILNQPFGPIWHRPPGLSSIKGKNILLGIDLFLFNPLATPHFVWLSSLTHLH